MKYSSVSTILSVASLELQPPSSLFPHPNLLHPACSFAFDCRWMELIGWPTWTCWS